MLARIVALLVAGLLVLSGGSLMLPNWHGVVSGGIFQCSGLMVPGAPRYAAGTVTVLEGQVFWKASTSPDLVPVLPTKVVASQRVGIDAEYFFVLEPGRYVLQATYSDPIDVEPFADVVVEPGDDIRVDLGGCL